MAIRVSPAPKPLRTVYDNFKGVDFSTDDLLVDRNHSPYCLNMISDKGGQPEKRAGWRILKTVDSPINCMQQGFIDGKNLILIHGGTKLYKLQDDTITELASGLNNQKSSIFFAEHKSKTKGFILTGKEYFVYDGNKTEDVANISTIPLFTIARKPEGGGTQLNALNLLQPGFTEAFAGDGTSTAYHLSFNGLDNTTVKVEIMESSGKWIDKTENTDFTVNRESGIVTFTSAPGKSPVGGEDNVKITAYRTVNGYADRIKKCLSYSRFGIGGNNRVFVTRNADYKAQDWWSELNDPTYFPDLNYAVIGNNNTAVMGYAKLGETQLIIKEDNQQDTTVFSRTALLQDKTPTFPVKIGITGNGAVSPYSFAQLVDEPLFLSRNGVYAVTSNAITYERTLQNRSYYVDARLTKEPNLENAVAVQWDNYYLLGINGNVYLLDSRQKSVSRDNPNSFVYECFFWDNIFVNCWLVYDGELYFGDLDGNICKFNTDIVKMNKYNDNGKPITAIWTTKLDDDNMPEMTKTLQKKGCVVTTKPFTRSNIEIGIRTSDMSNPFVVKSQYLGVLDFNDIDFEYFTFISNDNARTVVIKKKIKKYRALQFVLKNDKLNQGFGIFNIVKNYVAVNYVKE